MQLIEVTVFGVRSVVLTFAKEGFPTFLVPAMVHIGEPDYYAAVRKQLESCQRIVVEGVAGRRTSALTLSYRLAGRIRRDGLVLQARGLSFEGLRDRLVRPDLDAKQFGRSWRRVPRLFRWLTYAIVPVFAIYLAIVGPRRAITTDFATEDLESRDEALMPDGVRSVTDSIGGDRDRALAAAIVELAQARDPVVNRIGVCWGAQHLRVIAPTLMHGLGYRIAGAEWLTVMS